MTQHKTMMDTGLCRRMFGQTYTAIVINEEFSECNGLPAIQTRSSWGQFVTLFSANVVGVEPNDFFSAQNDDRRVGLHGVCSSQDCGALYRRK
jgi:hypothetical protein